MLRPLVAHRMKGVTDEQSQPHVRVLRFYQELRAGLGMGLVW